jgi:hypothetical protein
MATQDSLQHASSTDAQDPAGSGARWAWLASAAMLGGAAALALVPRAVHAAGPAVAELARMGVTWPLLAGFGVVIAAVATTARRAPTSAAMQPVPEPESKASLAQDPLARDIAGELARVRGGLHDLRVEFVYVKDALSRLQQTASQADAESDHDAEAAIFRLAASLDQLGGRIEHELSTQRTWLSGAMEELTKSATQASSALPAFADPYLQGFEGSAHEIHPAEGFVAHDDDLHVEVALESDASWLNGLGVLDEIEEPRAPLAHGKTSPSSRPTTGESLLGDFGRMHSAPDGIGLKMAQLRELLSDPAVQRALESQAR